MYFEFAIALERPAFQAGAAEEYFAPLLSYSNFASCRSCGCGCGVRFSQPNVRFLQPELQKSVFVLKVAICEPELGRLLCFLLSYLKISIFEGCRGPGRKRFYTCKLRFSTGVVARYGVTNSY